MSTGKISNLLFIAKRRNLALSRALRIKLTIKSLLMDTLMIRHGIKKYLS